MGRNYTGWDGNAPGKRAGMEEFIRQTSAHFGNGVWNNGSWVVRNMNNKNAKARPSVHGTGRAADMSWRKVGAKGFGDYNQAIQVVDFWVANAELFLIEEIHDYFPKPYGRGWRCSRNSWKVYDKPTIGSAPGGDWFHVEIAPAYADNADYYKQAFASATGGAPAPKMAPAPAAAPGVDMLSPDAPMFAYPGHSIGLKHEHAHEVMLIQAIVGAKPDGDFGPRTEALVKAWQTKNGLKPDGVVGPVTWDKMF